MTNSTIVFVTGKIYWPKIIGNPRMNYEQTGREWAYDFMPDDTTFLKDHRLLDRLKEDDRGTIPGPFLRLKKPELDKDGNKNEPIRVYDNTGDETIPWDDRLLGNGTEVVAKLSIVDWGKGKKQSIYTQALRVEKLVSYTSNEFAGYDTSPAKAMKKASKGKVATADRLVYEGGLDDEIPF